MFAQDRSRPFDARSLPRPAKILIASTAIIVPRWEADLAKGILANEYRRVVGVEPMVSRLARRSQGHQGRRKPSRWSRLSLAASALFPPAASARSVRTVRCNYYRDGNRSPGMAPAPTAPTAPQDGGVRKSGPSSATIAMKSTAPHTLWRSGAKSRCLPTAQV